MKTSRKQQGFGNQSSKAFLAVALACSSLIGLGTQASAADLSEYGCNRFYNKFFDATGIGRVQTNVSWSTEDGKPELTLKADAGCLTAAAVVMNDSYGQSQAPADSARIDEITFTYHKNKLDKSAQTSDPVLRVYVEDPTNADSFDVLTASTKDMTVENQPGGFIKATYKIPYPCKTMDLKAFAVVAQQQLQNDEPAYFTVTDVGAREANRATFDQAQADLQIQSDKISHTIGSVRQLLMYPIY